MTPLVQTIVQGAAVFALAPVLLWAGWRVKPQTLGRQFLANDDIGGSWMARIAPQVVFALAVVVVLAAPIMDNVGLLEVFADPVTTGMLLGSMYLVLALGAYDAERNAAHLMRGLVLSVFVFAVLAVGSVWSAVNWPVSLATVLVAAVIAQGAPAPSNGHSGAVVRVSFLAAAIALAMTALLPFHDLIAIGNPIAFFVVRAVLALALIWIALALFKKLNIVRTEDQLSIAAVFAVVALVLAVALPIV